MISHDESVENRLFVNLSLKYKLPVKGLSYEIRFGGNKRDKERRRFYGPTTFQGKQILDCYKLGVQHQLRTRLTISCDLIETLTEITV